MGRGEKNFIFEKENSDIDSIVLQIVGVNFHSNFFLLFTPHGPMKGGKKTQRHPEQLGSPPLKDYINLSTDVTI